MRTIKVVELMQNRTYPEAGAALYALMERYMDEKDQKIDLDLTGVEVLPSMFLNMSIGRYIESYGYKELQKRLSFSSITKSQAERIKDYVSKYL